jgi:protein TonB
MKFCKILIVVVLLGLSFSGFICGKKEIQRSREDFVYLSFNVFIFEAARAEEKLEFTPFPTIVSTNAIDQIFRDAEQYYESLKSLSAFNRFLLLTPLTQKMKLLRTSPLKIEAMRKSSSTAESGYEVEIIPQRMEEEMVQLRVAVQKGGKLFFSTDVSAPMDKSVVIGRMMEQSQKALLVTFYMEEEKDSSVMLGLDTAGLASSPEPTQAIQMDSEPIPLDYVHPAYPESARREGVEGTVWVRVLVDESGDVANAVVIKSAREDLDQAALESAWKVEYRPAKSQGKPVAVWMVYSITFKLDE